MKAARQGFRLTLCSSPRGHLCAGEKYPGSGKKALVDHISGPRVLGLCQPMVDVVLSAGVFKGVRPNGLAGVKSRFDCPPSAPLRQREVFK
jgi:hypothetical protein